MAEIVLGMGTSHGPMLSTPPEGWGLRVADDVRMEHHYRGRTWSYQSLLSERRHEGLDAQATPDVWQRRHDQCRLAITRLADVFAAARADVAVVVGNDQMECFSDSLVPAFAVLYGDQVVNSEYTAERLARLPPGIEVSMRGRIPPGGAVYPAQADLGRHIISDLMSDGFDVAAMRRLPGDLTPHAFGFVYRQIMRDQVIPSVPVFINTFYPPNQPSVNRCYALGKSLVRSIRSWRADVRVALIATGGLTHFVIDERVDGLFFDALSAGDITKIAGLGESTFQAGTSEMKNWIPVAGAMAELGWRAQIVDYVPCYRSAAGTGNAMAFVYWQA
jgi:3-O-methylgallate 3,4-dioxygenase